MQTKIETAADLNALPAFLRLSLRSVGTTTAGLYAYKTVKERKAAIQAAARRAIIEGFISYGLAVEILTVNGAYGPKGKAALDDLKGE